jgi:hypothetical protein
MFEPNPDSLRDLLRNGRLPGPVLFVLFFPVICHAETLVLNCRGW